MRRKTWLAMWTGLAALAAGTSSAAADTYALKQYIPVPPSADNPIDGNFATFDISAFDGRTRLYYVSDRSNASIDIFSARTNSFVGRTGGTGHVFTGQKATNGLSGPNRLLIVDYGAHRVYAGNADSTLLGFDIPAPDDAHPIVKIATGQPDQNRVDEISYDPATHTILAGNNSTEINFASLVDVDPASATFGTVLHKIIFDGRDGVPSGRGLEASTYNASTGTFFQATQHIRADPANPGGLVEIDPRTGKITRVLELASAQFGSLATCAPSGVSAALSGRMMIGCSVASQSMVIDPVGPGRIVATFTQVSGVDEVYYDPSSDRWFLAARDNPGGPVVGVVDAATNTFLQNIPTTFNAHSVAVDPVSGEVFIPEGAHPSNLNCPKGCIAVFAKSPK